MNAKDYLYPHIIAIDPSGAFYEGQGTTGICVFNTVDKYVQHSQTIAALKYEAAYSYWNAHISVLEDLLKKYPKAAVVVEDYILYGEKAMEQVNSRMETCQLLGVLKYHLSRNRIPHRIETASTVMGRWTNDILEYKGYIKKKGRSFVDARGNKLCRHELDAVRHAVHNATFYNTQEGAHYWKRQY